MENDRNRVFCRPLNLVAENTLVCLYPGTIYEPWEPKMLPSINNDVFLQCIDRKYIDAKCRGISKFIYKSCESRERCYPGLKSADLSWIDAARYGQGLFH